MRRFMLSRTRWYWVLRSMKSMAGDDNSDLTQHLIDRLVRKLIRALVAGHARVALHPVPLDAMPLDLALQRLPEIDVLHGLLVRSAPVARLPLRQPLSDAFAHVLRVGVERYRARSLQSGERTNRGCQLHAIVRR